MKDLLKQLRIAEIAVSLLGSILLIAGSWWTLSADVQANAVAIKGNKEAIHLVAEDVKESSTTMSEINSRLIVLETHLIYIRQNMAKEEE